MVHAGTAKKRFMFQLNVQIQSMFTALRSLSIVFIITSGNCFIISAVSGTAAVCSAFCLYFQFRLELYFEYSMANKVNPNMSLYNFRIN